MRWLALLLLFFAPVAFADDAQLVELQKKLDAARRELEVRDMIES